MSSHCGFHLHSPNSIEHLFMGFLAICPYSLEKYLNNRMIFCYVNCIVENLSEMGQSTFILDWYFHDCTLHLLVCWCWKMLGL